METVKTQYLAVFIGIAAVALPLVFYLLNRKRRKDLAQLAAAMGLSFSPDGPDITVLEKTWLEIFLTGSSRKAANLMQAASRAGNISFFDYSYTTSGGKSAHGHHVTLALITCPGLTVPDFDLKPETFLHKIGEAIGFKDIDLPAFPLFSDKYRLTGLDEDPVRMFFTPQRASWFERNPGLRIQGTAGHIVVFRREGLLPVESWQSFIEEVKAFAAEVL